MGFFLTLVYIALALLSPADLFPSLAGFRIELVVALLALPFSAQSLLTDRVLRSPQAYLLAGLFPAVFLSQAIGNSWIGGGVFAMLRFLPVAVAFYLILLNCDTLGRLKSLACCLALIGAGLVLTGGIAYITQDLSNPLLLVLKARDESGAPFLRMRGLGFLNDPNDLAQFLALIIPFAWLLWERGRKIRNAFLVVGPTMFFIAGIYMTQSRGGMLALLVILLLGMKDRFGIVASALFASFACVFFLLMNFTGGREVSMAAGSDRMALWGSGLELFKSSPLFGIGWGSFADQNGGRAAHNSFVLCLAELGIGGYMLWIGLLVSTFHGLNSCIAMLRPRDVASPESSADSDASKLEVCRWARMLRISLAGYLAASCFLSRAYIFTLYVILAMALAVCWLEPEGEKLVAKLPPLRLVGRTAMFGFGAITIFYAFLRARSLLPGPQ